MTPRIPLFGGDHGVAQSPPLKLEEGRLSRLADFDSFVVVLPPR